MNSVELFAGAGGLAMGVAQAGFQHLGIVECDQWCCETINHNRLRHISPVADWPPVTPMDVKDVRFDQLRGDIAPGRRGAEMADVVPRFRIPPGFKAIRLKPDDTPFFGWQTEDSEPDDDYRSMGKVPHKGYGLVDTDPRNNPDVDDELVAKYGEELISGWVERTPGGGFHIPVRLPEDLWDMPQCQNGRDKKQLPSLPYGVDIKVGGKGYGLAAGSQRAKDGGWYLVAQEGPAIDMPEAMANDIRRDLGAKKKEIADAELAAMNASVGLAASEPKRAPSTGYAWEEPNQAATRIMAARVPPDDWHEWSKLCCAFLSAGKSIGEVEDWCCKNPAKYHASEDRRFLEKQVSRGYEVRIGYAINWARAGDGVAAKKSDGPPAKQKITGFTEANKKRHLEGQVRRMEAWKLFWDQGMLPSEIASRTELEVETVKKHLRKIVKDADLFHEANRDRFRDCW